MYRVVIPARYGSTRLPGKPLLLLAGKPMIQWVYERARRSRAQQVIVATDDERIAQAARELRRRGAADCRDPRFRHRSHRRSRAARALGRCATSS